VALKCITKAPNQKVASSSSSSSSSPSSSDGLVLIYLTLSRWFSHKTAAFSTEQCTSPSLFSRFKVPQGSSHSLKNYDFLCNAICCQHCNLYTQKYNLYAWQTRRMVVIATVIFLKGIRCSVIRNTCVEVILDFQSMCIKKTHNA